jgi:hypothetical protein
MISLKQHMSLPSIKQLVACAVTIILGLSEGKALIRQGVVLLQGLPLGGQQAMQSGFCGSFGGISMRHGPCPCIRRLVMLSAMGCEMVKRSVSVAGSLTDNQLTWHKGHLLAPGSKQVMFC